MICFNCGTVCKQYLNNVEDFEKNMTDDRWYIDILPIFIPLWRKHDVKAHNFGFEPSEGGNDGNIRMTFDLAGSTENINSFYNDLFSNMVYFQEGLVDLFDAAHPARDVIREHEELEKKRELERNPPPRPKYDAKIHKFVN